jgi:diadenylate cyclase
MNFAAYIADSFKNFNFADAIMIALLIAAVLFVYFYAIRHNSLFFSYILFIAAIIVFAITFLSNDENLGFFRVGLVALLCCYFIATLILYRNELRRDIFKSSFKKRFYLVTGEKDEVLTQEDIESSISKIVKACQNMSKTDVGALIIVVKDGIYDYIIESGTYINAKISSELLETIFFPKSPLHDGAVIIKGDKILAAGCYLPLSQEINLPKEFGTRHRAALGLTESHPTLTAVVVSEETGIITAMYDKHFKRYLDGNTLTKALQICYDVKTDVDRETFWGIDNYGE